MLNVFYAKCHISLIMLSVVMLTVIMLSVCRYAECLYAECRYAECHHKNALDYFTTSFMKAVKISVVQVDCDKTASSSIFFFFDKSESRKWLALTNVTSLQHTL
jgi:hypothetical protein